MTDEDARPAQPYVVNRPGDLLRFRRGQGNVIVMRGDVFNFSGTAFADVNVRLDTVHAETRVNGITVGAVGTPTVSQSAPPNRKAEGLTRFSIRLLPVRYREEYRLEFASDLHELRVPTGGGVSRVGEPARRPRGVTAP
jgi:hypothetical protein